MDFSQHPPSKHWTAVKYRGEPFAEVWFKPEGQPFALTFRIPRESFHIPGLGQLLTPENLLKAVGITAAEVESWHCEGASPAHSNENNHGLRSPLLSPPQDVTHLQFHVRLRQSPQAVVPAGSAELEVPEARWQDLEACWNAILGLEASIDTLRLSMEALRTEMEASTSRALTLDEKLHALNADVAQWNKAKSRVLYTLPKLRDFIHRSTWATGTPGRKHLEEVYKNHIRPRVPFPQMDQVTEQLENLRKDRQVLSAQGASVYQEARSISAELQGTLILQRPDR